jgi:hypothetical protein
LAESGGSSDDWGRSRWVALKERNEEHPHCTSPQSQHELYEGDVMYIGLGALVIIIILVLLLL